MKIAFIAAGAASMYCGSCLRDNAVAGGLIKLGHDVTLIPLYTPLRLDRDDATNSPVFYGGINIFLQQKFALFRRFGALDRLLNSGPMLSLASKFAGMTQAKDLGELTLSTLQGDEGRQRREVEKLADWLATEIKPDIINLPNSMFVGVARELRNRTGAPVICSLTGEDLFLDGLIEPYKSECLKVLRARAREVAGFIAISEYYAGHMSEMLQVPRERIHVVRIGINPAGYGRKGPRPIDPFTIGYLARIDPDKGLHVLAEAFRELKQMPGTESVRLRVAGWLGPQHKGYLADVVKKMRSWGLENAMEYIGEVTFEEKLKFLDTISVLSVPTVYRDPKGLFVLEALAHGVPVVTPAHGAFPELIAATGGGLLSPPGDARALAAQLHTLLVDPERADALARAGQAAVLANFTDARMARETLAVYEKYRHDESRKAQTSEFATMT